MMAGREPHKQMTIVYASDKNYAALTAISAVSLLKHNPGARIVLLGYNLEADAQELVRSRVEKAGGEFGYVDVSPAIADLKDKGYCGYTSYAAYARVFIPQVLHEVGRVLYLDCDTLVDGSLEDLFGIDLHGKPFALACDCIHSAYKRAINHPRDLPYFNSGVMLIDIAQWRASRCTERMLDELANPRGPNPLGDQDIIVRCFSEETEPLPPKWNFLSQYFMLSYDGWRRIVGKADAMLVSREDYEKARSGATIYHFSGHTLGRPWFTSSKHPLREKYRLAAAEAGLPEIAEQFRPMVVEYRLQYWLYRLLPQWLFDNVCRWMYRTHVRLEYHV